jgi:uracil-DNA glycosylase family 4
MNEHTDITFTDPMAPEDILNWYMEMGVDECIADESTDRYAFSEAQMEKRKAAIANPPPASMSAPVISQKTAAPAPKVPATDEMVQDAVQRAQKSKTMDELEAAVSGFEGCVLKQTALNTVFCDGNPKAKVMILGDAPATAEDREGKPFAGLAGQLLDKMLFASGLSKEMGDRSDVFLSNILYWRPPGNRAPTPSEIALCLPFVERQIELVDPSMIILFGETAAKAILGRHESLSKLQGRWFEHSTPGLSHPVAATVVYHPDYLLKSPVQKRKAWRDLLAISERLKNL